MEPWSHAFDAACFERLIRPRQTWDGYHGLAVGVDFRRGWQLRAFALMQALKHCTGPTFTPPQLGENIHDPRPKQLWVAARPKISQWVGLSECVLFDRLVMKGPFTRHTPPRH